MGVRFNIAPSTVVKWSKLYRATGAVTPGKMGGHRKRVLPLHRDFIINKINQTSHLTLEKLQAELAKQGITVSRNTIWVFLRREGLSFKKNLFELEQARGDIARRRERWRRLQHALDRAKLVFIDETWIKTNMTPLRGWGQKGQTATQLCSPWPLENDDLPWSLA